MFLTQKGQVANLVMTWPSVVVGAVIHLPRQSSWNQFWQIRWPVEWSSLSIGSQHIPQLSPRGPGPVLFMVCADSGNNCGSRACTKSVLSTISAARSSSGMTPNSESTRLHDGRRATSSEIFSMIVYVPNSPQSPRLFAYLDVCRELIKDSLRS
jgi:hypothetical protein